MAQTGFTPILTYASNTAASVPSAGNLTNSANGSELAVNTADRRLFTKNSGGTVVELGNNPSALTVVGTTTLSALTASTALALNASKEVVSVTNTGTGNNVLATSPTLVTPILGTPTSVTLTNATGLPLATGVTGTLATTNGGTGLTSFTSGGVVYASSTSALATGSALTFNGSDFGVSASVATATLASSGAYSALSFTNSGGAAASGTILTNSSGILQSRAATHAYTNADASTEYMRLTSSGLEVKQSQLIGYSSYAGIGTNGLAVAGNVGIGTSSPWSQLTVGSGGTANPAATVSFHAATANEYRLKLTSAAFNADTAWLGLGFGYSDNYMKAAIIAEAKDANARANLHFALNDSASSTNASLSDSKMVLTYAGNLGIGTSSPAYKLDVVGALNLQGSSTFPTTGMFLRSADNQLKIIGGSAGISFAAQSGASTYALLDSSGNLGLGVTPSASWSGQSAFQVNARSAFAGSSSFTSVATNAIATSNGWSANYLANGFAALYTQGVSTGVHSWFTAPSGTAGNAISFTQAMTLDASGNLGVGVTSALSRIDARAASAVIANYQTIQAFSTDSAAINLGGGIGLGGYYSGTAAVAIFGNVTGRKENATDGNFSGYLAFGTNNNSTGTVERARITSGGVLDIGTGAGAVGQIQFPATQVASANANTLDDYEEGTWTPSIGGTATYTYQTGRYTKIGRMVYVSAIFQVNTIGTGSTSQISGLPFSGASGYTGTEASLSVSYFSSSASNLVCLYANAVSASVEFYGLTAAANGTSAISPFQNGARIDFAGWYIAAN